MDAVKVENFLREKPTADFPRFESLGTIESAHLRAAIAKRVGLAPDCEPQLILSTLIATAEALLDVNAEHFFDFRDLILRLRLKACEDVFVNWNRFENIDKIAVSDLSENFADIWYPSSDDIEIFDASLEWFVLVRHDGLVSVLNLSPPKIVAVSVARSDTL
jgi:hypothetical protein